jgi:hypothetical protein
MTLPITPDVPEEGSSDNGCLVATTAVLLSFEFEQAFADDLKFLINQASRRVKQFKGSHGTLTFNWLGQLQAFTQSTNDGLFCLLHNPPAALCDNSDPTTQGGGALLDILAQNNVQSLCTNGSLGGLKVSSTLQAAFNQAIMAPPAQRFAQLTPCQQVELRQDYLSQKIGTIDVSYQSTISSSTILHGLLMYSVNNISFEIDINNTQIVQDFTVGKNDIHLHASLPKFSGKAWLETSPGPTFFEAIAASTVGCLFLGVGCNVVAQVAIVAIFLTAGVDYVTLNLNDPAVDVHVTLKPDAQQRLLPTLVARVTADVKPIILDIPPTFQFIADPILSAVFTNNTAALDEISLQLTKKLQGLLSDQGWSFPLPALPVPDQYVQSAASGLASQFLDAISEEDPSFSASVPNVWLISSEDQLTHRFRDIAPQFPASVNLANLALGTVPAHFWGGYGISQNYLNLLATSLSQSDGYKLELSQAQLQALVVAIGVPVPSSQLNELSGHLQPDAPPRIFLTPHDAAAGNGYAQAHFDDLRLCLTIGKRDMPAEQVIEFRFGAQMAAEVAFGSLNSSTNQLDITKSNPTRLLNLYYDLANITLDPAVQSVATLGSTFAAVTDNTLPQLQNVFSALVAGMLVNDTAWIPRQQGDPGNLQRFPFGNSTWYVCQLLPVRGNLYLQQGIGGIAWTILPQLAKPPNQGGLSCQGAKTLLALGM